MLATACGNDDGGTTATVRTSVVTGIAANGGPVAWPAPPANRVGELVESAGLHLETKESLVNHVHAHLDVFVHGVHRTVPGGIGIVISDPTVHTGTVEGQPAYGGIAGCAQPCISPLHTHDVTGILHTESLTFENNTLGQFFKEWNVRFDDTCVGDSCTPGTAIMIYVDGKTTALRGATAIPLADHTEIAIVIGKPPARIPDTADFTQA